MFRLLTAVALIGIVSGCSEQTDLDGEPRKPRVSFIDDVVPVLVSKCAECHIKKKEGGLSLLSFDAMTKQKKGQLVVAGKPDESALLKVLESKAMPKKGEPLTDEQLATIRKWVTEGGRFDGNDRFRELVAVSGPVGAGRGRPPGLGGGGPRPRPRNRPRFDDQTKP